MTRTIPEIDDLPVAVQPQQIEVAVATSTKPAEKKLAPGLDLQRQLVASKDATAGWKSVVFIMAAVNIGLNILFLLGIVMVASKPISSLVVKSNGVMESLEEQVGNKRNPDLIKLWVKDSMTSIYTFKNVLPQEGRPIDPGVLVNEEKVGKSDGATTATANRKLPTISYRYTFAIDPSFAKHFRVGLAELIASVEGGQANAEAAYVIDSISDPKETRPGAGVWKLDIVGSWLISHGGGKVDRTMPMNKTVTVKAVPPIRESEAMALYKDKDGNDAAKMAKNLMQISAAGLRITEIVDLN